MEVPGDGAGSTRTSDFETLTPCPSSDMIAALACLSATLLGSLEQTLTTEGFGSVASTSLRGLGLPGLTLALTIPPPLG